MDGNQEPRVEHPRKLSDSFNVCCSSDYSNVFHGLNEQRKKGLFCDVVLVVGGARFPAHRSTLAASSDYFNSMFTRGMQESYPKEVKLAGASPNGFQAVLAFLYGSEVSLDSTIMVSVLKTAHLLQILKLVDMCCKYLAWELNEENYLQFQELASTYSLESLDSSIDCFILENFEILSSTPCFIEKASVEKLCLYLDSDQVQVNEEHDLLKVALQWLSFCPERAKEADRVLQNIRFSLIPESDLINHVKPAISSLVLAQQLNCLSFIDEAIHYHNNLTAQPVLQNRRSTLRADGEQLLYLGGTFFEIPQVEKNANFFDCQRGEWMQETELPQWYAEFSVAVLGNYIFCAGGYIQQATGQYIQHEVYRYDPRWNQWIQVASMRHCRRSFYLAALEDRLVAVGGDVSAEIPSSCSVEMYNPQTDSWHFAASLPRSCYKHAGATLRQRIYISGGQSHDDWMVMRNLLCYDYRTDTWEEKRSMSTARCNHSMCSLGELIYAIGGTNGVEEGAYNSVECYSPLCDQWTTLAPMLEPTNHSGAAVWKGEIYVLGSGNFDTPSKTVQVYDHKENKWYKGQELPDYILGLTACVCVLRP